MSKKRLIDLNKVPIYSEYVDGDGKYMNIAYKEDLEKAEIEMEFRVYFTDIKGEPIFGGITSFVPRIGERIFRTVTEIYTVVDVVYVVVDGVCDYQLVNVMLKKNTLRQDLSRDEVLKNKLKGVKDVRN